MNLHSVINGVVNDKPGINAVELVLECFKIVFGKGESFTHHDFLMAVGGLVDNGQIREEEYINPEIPYRLKSRYYPS